MYESYLNDPEHIVTRQELNEVIEEMAEKGALRRLAHELSPIVQTFRPDLQPKALVQDTVLVALTKVHDRQLIINANDEVVKKKRLKSWIYTTYTINCLNAIQSARLLAKKNIRAYAENENDKGTFVTTSKTVNSQIYNNYQRLAEFENANLIADIKYAGVLDKLITEIRNVFPELEDEDCIASNELFMSLLKLFYIKHKAKIKGTKQSETFARMVRHDDMPEQAGREYQNRKYVKDRMKAVFEE